MLFCKYRTIAIPENKVLAKDLHSVDDLDSIPGRVLLLLASHDDNGDVVRLGVS